MPVASPPAPSAAERIRSVCVRATGAMLAVDGHTAVDTPVHHLLDDGAFAVTAAADGDMTAAAGNATGVEAVLELTDHAPLALRSPGSRPGYSTSTRTTRRLSTCWPPACRCRCAGAGFARWASTATGCVCGWSEPTAITMCDYRSRRRSTT